MCHLYNVGARLAPSPIYGPTVSYYEKHVDVVYIGAKIQDIGRLAYRGSGRKNPRLYKPINKAVDTELVL